MARTRVQFYSEQDKADLVSHFFPSDRYVPVQEDYHLDGNFIIFAEVSDPDIVENQRKIATTSDPDFSGLLSATPAQIRDLVKAANTVAKLQKIVGQLAYALAVHVQEHHNG